MDTPDRVESGFRHEAFLYATADEFLAGAVPFVEAGIRGGEPVLVAVPGGRVDLLRDALDPTDRDAVRFVDMEDMGRNPARIIPAWADFVATTGGAPARGIGEPAWAGRSPAEIVECEHHEALLNLAFADTAAFELLCPYDDAALDADVISGAHRNHTHIGRAGHRPASASYAPNVVSPASDPLPPAPPEAIVHSLAFDGRNLGPLRRRVEAAAAHAGLDPARTDDLVVAVSEAASNSVRHGGGSGRVTVWRDHDRLCCEVHDQGHIDEPLIGRVKPDVTSVSGRGMWIINQLCDLVQIRSSDHGQVVRLHVTL